MQWGYVAIKIESLTVAWAVEKFHHFLYGCHFILETDQKPLEAILSRSLNQATPRIQCILIRTLPYNSPSDTYWGQDIYLQTACHDWAISKMLLNCQNSMCTTYLTNFRPGAIAYKPSGKPPKLMMNLPSSGTQ